jgi:hypothetical protein
VRRRQINTVCAVQEGNLSIFSMVEILIQSVTVHGNPVSR